jgi:methionyl-tRNA synthetase
MNEISYDDFAKLEVRIGTVTAAELVPDTDKLIKCTVDFGEPPEGVGVRTIVSGIAQWKKPEELLGRQFPYITNLTPRVLRGITSEGMLLAASDNEGVALLAPERVVPQGTKLH